MLLIHGLDICFLCLDQSVLAYGATKISSSFFFLADLNFISLPDQALIQLHLHAGRLPSLFSFPFCFLDKRY